MSPQLQRGSEDCFQRTMLAAQRLCPVLKRFSSTHSLHGSSWPGSQTDGTATREWFTTSVADHSALQAARAVMSSAGWLHHIGHLVMTQLCKICLKVGREIPPFPFYDLWLCVLLIVITIFLIKGRNNYGHHKVKTARPRGNGSVNFEQSLALFHLMQQQLLCTLSSQFAWTIAYPFTLVYLLFSWPA